MPITHRYDIPAGTFRSLVESGVIVLQDNSNILEITDNKDIKIFGNYTHIAEGLIRAAWCVKDKSLNPYIF